MALCTRNSRHYPCSTHVFATLGYGHAVWSDQAASSPPGGDYPIGSPAFFLPMLQALTGSGCLPSASVARRRLSRDTVRRFHGQSVCSGLGLGGPAMLVVRRSNHHL